MMKRITTAIWLAAVIAFALLPLMIGLSMGQEPVEGKKNRDKHKQVEPVTPAPAPHIEPEPDTNFTDVIPDQPDIEKKPKKPDRVEPERRPVAPVEPKIVYRGSWSSWFAGVFVGIVLGVVGSWLATMTSVVNWIKGLFGR